ncbi:MAG: GSCFA domain-containing protein [Bacteroidetes bacterium]|nr:MAG: GSCFA domain-containing protein [Bacteroidota bacterium]
MKLQTKIPLEKQPNNLIDYNSKILLLGSCFAENISEKLEYFKFQNTINPFGILFHPKAVERLIANAINEKEYSEKDVFFHDERWHCFDAHSVLSNTSKEQLLLNLNSNIKLTYKQIHESTHIIITLGTAWVYRFIENNQIVTNCHKVPQKQFKKEILTVDEIASSIESIERKIRLVNANVQIIYTVSPVRHLKNGFVLNQQSKSHLITAIHNFFNHNSEIQNRNSFYFPSYEIMMDELRDYRFYAEDMLHPNKTAINYIWEKFKQVWISQDASTIIDEVESIQKGLLHKPFNPNSNSHKQFLKNIESKKAQIHKQFPHIIF